MTTTTEGAARVAILSHPGGWLPQPTAVIYLDGKGVAILSHPGGWLPRLTVTGEPTLLWVAILSHPGGWLPLRDTTAAGRRLEVAILSHPGGWLPQHLKCANALSLGALHHDGSRQKPQPDTDLLGNLPGDP